MNVKRQLSIVRWIFCDPFILMRVQWKWPELFNAQTSDMRALYMYILYRLPKACNTFCQVFLLIVVLLPLSLAVMALFEGIKGPARKTLTVQLYSWLGRSLTRSHTHSANWAHIKLPDLYVCHIAHAHIWQVHRESIFGTSMQRDREILASHTNNENNTNAVRNELWQTSRYETNLR